MKTNIKMSVLAKMARDIKSVSQEESSEMVTNVVRLKDAYDDLLGQLIEIKKQAEIARQEVKFLSVSSEIDCNNCVNKGQINGLSQETFCDGCIHADKWRVNHFIPREDLF